MKAGFVYCSPAHARRAVQLCAPGIVWGLHAWRMRKHSLTSFRDCIMKQDSIRPCNWEVKG